MVALPKPATTGSVRLLVEVHLRNLLEGHAHIRHCDIKQIIECHHSCLTDRRDEVHICFPNFFHLQQQSKVCIQTFALLYIAAFLCIPDCLGIMSTGDYVIKFERNSFRVQLSARGIAICFASAQAQVRGGKWSCGLSWSLSLSAV